MKKYLLGALKALVSVGLIVWLLQRANLTLIWDSISSANHTLLLIAFLQFFIGYFITARRWQSLLHALNVTAKLSTLIQSFSISIFFNNFLPSTIGGDAYRIYDSYRLGAGKLRAIAVVFVDRIIGLSSLLLLALVASFFAGDLATRIPLLQVFLLAVVIGIGALSWTIFGRGSQVLFELTQGKYSILTPLNHIMEKIHGGFCLFQGRNDVMLKAIGLSLLLQINVVFHYIIIGWSLNIEISLLVMFIIIPLANLIMIIPVSINGIGLRESIFVLFFGFYGIVREQALAFAFIVFAMILSQGILGGIMFIFRKRLNSSQTSNPKR